MRRTYFYAAVGVLLIAGSLVAAQVRGRPVQTSEYSGRIVKMDPRRGIITIQSGQGPNAVEQNFQVVGNTRYYAKNNAGIIEGLRNTNFRPGADVWYRTYPGPNNNNALSELRLGPTLPPMPPQGK